MDLYQLYFILYFVFGEENNKMGCALPHKIQPQRRPVEPPLEPPVEPPNNVDIPNPKLENKQKGEKQEQQMSHSKAYQISETAVELQDSRGRWSAEKVGFEEARRMRIPKEYAYMVSQNMLEICLLNTFVLRQ